MLASFALVPCAPLYLTATHRAVTHTRSQPASGTQPTVRAQLQQRTPDPEPSSAREAAKAMLAPTSLGLGAHTPKMPPAIKARSMGSLTRDQLVLTRILQFQCPPHAQGKHKPATFKSAFAFKHSHPCTRAYSYTLKYSPQNTHHIRAHITRSPGSRTCTRRKSKQRRVTPKSEMTFS